MKNSGSSEEELLGLMSRCVPLLFECPMVSESPDCPLGEVRKLGVTAQVKWLKTRSAPELKALLARHEQCSKGR